VYLLVSIIPVRLGRILVLAARDAARARHGARYAGTLPVIAAGHLAWVAGEAVAHVRWLLRHADGDDARGTEVRVE
jgi:hypothetical protein